MSVPDSATVSKHTGMLGNPQTILSFMLVRDSHTIHVASSSGHTSCGTIVLHHVPLWYIQDCQLATRGTSAWYYRKSYSNTEEQVMTLQT